MLITQRAYSITTRIKTLAYRRSEDYLKSQRAYSITTRIKTQRKTSLFWDFLRYSESIFHYNKD